MKFCSFCGKELNDGRCDCAEFISTNPMPVSEPVTETISTPVTEPEYVEAEPAPAPAPSVAIEPPSNLVEELLSPLKIFLKSRKEAARHLSFASMGIYAGAAFVISLLSILFIFLGAGLADFMDKMFGRTLLMSFLMVLYTMVVQSAIIVIRKLIKKEPLKFESALFNTSAFNAFTYAAILFPTSLLSFLSFKISLVFVLFTSILSIVDTVELITESKSTWKQFMKYGVVTIITIIFMTIFSKIIVGGLSLGLLGMLM